MTMRSMSSSSTTFSDSCMVCRIRKSPSGSVNAVAARAPSRLPLVTVRSSRNTRPYSMIPKMNMNTRGSVSAASASTAPRSPRTLVDRRGLTTRSQNSAGSLGIGHRGRPLSKSLLGSTTVSDIVTTLCEICKGAAEEVRARRKPDSQARAGGPRGNGCQSVRMSTSLRPLRRPNLTTPSAVAKRVSSPPRPTLSPG